MAEGGCESDKRAVESEDMANRAWKHVMIRTERDKSGAVQRLPV